jgi:hypothetical protein
MRRIDAFAVTKIGDGAGDFEDAVVGAGGEAAPPSMRSSSREENPLYVTVVTYRDDRGDCFVDDVNIVSARIPKIGEQRHQNAEIYSIDLVESIPIYKYSILLCDLWRQHCVQVESVGERVDTLDDALNAIQCGYDLQVRRIRR